MKGLHVHRKKKSQWRPLICLRTCERCSYSVCIVHMVLNFDPSLSFPNSILFTEFHFYTLPLQSGFLEWNECCCWKFVNTLKGWLVYRKYACEATCEGLNQNFWSFWAFHRISEEEKHFSTEVERQMHGTYSQCYWVALILSNVLKINTRLDRACFTSV